MAQKDEVAIWKKENKKLIQERHDLLRQIDKLKKELDKCQTSLEYAKSTSKRKSKRKKSN